MHAKAWTPNANEMREVVEKIVKGIVDDEEAVEIQETDDNRWINIDVRVAPDDMGRLIGRQGRTIKAIRSLLYFAGQKHDKRYNLNIVED